MHQDAIGVLIGCDAPGHHLLIDGFALGPLLTTAQNIVKGVVFHNGYDMSFLHHDTPNHAMVG